jgi:hypothetical protein
MSVNLERLEAELSAMRPRALPAALAERIGAELTRDAAESRWPDRFLLSAIASGAIAACVIVTMLLGPAADGLPVPAPALADVATTSDPPRAGDFSLAMARAEFGP